MENRDDVQNLQTAGHTRKSRRREVGDAKPGKKKQPLDILFLKHKILDSLRPTIVLQLPDTEASEDFGAICRESRAIIQRKSGKKTSNAMLPSFMVNKIPPSSDIYFSDGVLCYRDQLFEKGSSVSVFHKDTFLYKGTIASLNSSEVVKLIRCG